MNKITYRPTWRHALEDIVLVSKPTREWIESVECEIIRFSLLANGDMIFGDAYTVLHKDICRIDGGSHHGPLLVGVLAKRGGTWRVSIAQYFAAGAVGAEAMALLRMFLPRHEDWSLIVKALGNDPLKEDLLGEVL